MGRDKGKGKGGGRGGRGGGGKMYVMNVEEMALRDEEQQIHSEIREKRRAEADEEGKPEGAEASPSPAGGGGGKTAGGKVEAAEASTVFGFEKVKKAVASVETDEEPVKVQKPKAVKLEEGVPMVDETEPGNRKQREAAEAIRKKEEYMRRHLAGETPEAKADIARLAKIREKREADAKKRAETGRAPGMSQTGLPSDSESDDSDSDDEEGAKPKAKASGGAPSAPVPAPAAPIVLSATQAKKKAAALETVPAAAAGGGGGAAEVLKAIDIKKMNGDALKDALRERGLDTQGAKKDLLKRLLDHEAARA